MISFFAMRIYEHKTLFFLNLSGGSDIVLAIGRNGDNTYVSFVGWLHDMFSDSWRERRTDG